MSALGRPGGAHTGAFRNWLRDIVYPGLDLHTRNRASLRRYWKTGPRDVLDAGSGNGYFSWLAYRTGARVVAMNFEQAQVEKAREFLLGHRKADPHRLRFEQRNLYDLENEDRTFDEIICFEVLEHMHRDGDVVAEFFRILRPGGVLHLCCPNRLHPRHQVLVGLPFVGLGIEYPDETYRLIGILPIGLTPKHTTSRRLWVRGRPRQGREGSGRPPSGCVVG